jgi:hypothetical protein
MTKPVSPYASPILGKQLHGNEFLGTLDGQAVVVRLNGETAAILAAQKRLEGTPASVTIPVAREQIVPL